MSDSPTRAKEVCPLGKLAENVANKVVECAGR